MRKEYEMSQEQLNKLKEASKPVMYIIIDGKPPRSPADNACDVWRQLGMEMNFEWDSAEPIKDKSQLYFTANPKEV